MPLEALRYVNYLDRWHLTPAQVDDLPLWLEPWLLPVAAAKDEAASQLRDRKSKPASRSFFRRGG